LREANEAGFLRIVESDSSEWKFRVHCSLAAAFGFSYRGAYYALKLRPDDLESLRTATDPREYKTIVRELGNRLSGEGDIDMPLLKGIQQ
jgi:hypothetical protein